MALQIGNSFSPPFFPRDNLQSQLKPGFSLWEVDLFPLHEGARRGTFLHSLCGRVFGDCLSGGVVFFSFSFAGGRSTDFFSFLPQRQVRRTSALLFFSRANRLVSPFFSGENPILPLRGTSSASEEQVIDSFPQELLKLCVSPFRPHFFFSQVENKPSQTPPPQVKEDQLSWYPLRRASVSRGQLSKKCSGFSPSRRKH